MANADINHRNPARAGAFIGSHAEYRTHDYFFPRAQSQLLRDADWGERVKPLKPWSEIVVLGLIGAAGVATALAVL